MEEFINKVKAIVETKVPDISDLDISLAIEIFIGLRNYPSSYKEKDILSDLNKHIATISMGAIELDSKDGVESQKADNENGHSRTYSESIIAYQYVIGFVKTMWF